MCAGCVSLHLPRGTVEKEGDLLIVHVIVRRVRCRMQQYFFGWHPGYQPLDKSCPWVDEVSTPMIDKLLSSAEKLTQMLKDAAAQAVDIATQLPALNDTSRRLIGVAEGVNNGMGRLNSTVASFLNMSWSERSRWADTLGFSSSELQNLELFVQLAATMLRVGQCLSAGAVGTMTYNVSAASPMADACGLVYLWTEFRRVEYSLNSALPYPQADLINSSQFSYIPYRRTQRLLRGGVWENYTSVSS